MEDIKKDIKKNNMKSFIYIVVLITAVMITAKSLTRKKYCQIPNTSIPLCVE